MAIDKGRDSWTGTTAGDIDEYLMAFSAGGYPVQQAVHAHCECGGEVFRVRVDDEEGCAELACVQCGRTMLILDSQDYVDDADLQAAACPCGNESFNVAVGFSFLDGSEDVRWVYLGLRCAQDGVLGCYTDWKIDYSPSQQLLDRV